MNLTIKLTQNREAASVNIEAVSTFDRCDNISDHFQLFKKYSNYKEGEEPWKKYGRVNDWNIDLVPKLLMSSGELTNILVSTDVTRYLEFMRIKGSFVYQGDRTYGTVYKVPSDAREALTSSLMGIWEKRRMKNFIEWVGAFNENDSTGHKGMTVIAVCITPVANQLVKASISTHAR